MSATRPINLIINTEAIEAVNIGADIPGEVVIDGDTFQIFWHATDAWRGYYQTTAPGGWLKLTDGWVTGNYDDAPESVRSGNVEEALDTLARTHPESTYAVIITPTSNAFASSYDVFIRKEQA